MPVAGIATINLTDRRGLWRVTERNDLLGFTPSQMKGTKREQGKFDESGRVADESARPG